MGTLQMLVSSRALTQTRRFRPRADWTPVASTPEPATTASVLPPRVVEASRPDPWQALNEGLSGCARQGLLDRMACEQRLRSQYCGNSWGLVPQCPIGPANDHGQ